MVTEHVSKSGERGEAYKFQAKSGAGIMQRLTLALALMLAMGLILLPVEGKAHMRHGMMGQGGYGDWQFCPYCGTLLGPSMMGPGHGRGCTRMHPVWGPGMMGSGMMHRGWGMGPQCGP